MKSPDRISVQEAKDKIDEGMAILVCIYDDEKFSSKAHLAGAIPMSEFEKMKPDLSRDTNIIFY